MRRSLLRALVARIHVVALGQRQRRRTNEDGIQSDHRARRITQRAIDAHAELLVAIKLFRCLQELALRERRFILANQPRLYLLQLAKEISLTR